MKIKIFWASFYGYLKEPQKIWRLINNLISLPQTQGIPAFVVINSLLKMGEAKIATENGVLLSIALMAVASLIVRFLMIIIYDFLKKDYLFLEMLKQKEQDFDEDQNFVIKKILKIKKSKKRFFLYLGLIVFDPFVLVIYLRGGHHRWNLLDNNWKIFGLFILSVIVCSITLYIFILFPIIFILGLIPSHIMVLLTIIL